MLGYIDTKPIIKSYNTEGNFIIFPSVELNYEFETRLLEYADRIRIIEPQKLGIELCKRVKDAQRQLDIYAEKEENKGMETWEPK